MGKVFYGGNETASTCKYEAAVTGKVYSNKIRLRKPWD